MTESINVYLSYHPHDRGFALKLAADLKNAGVRLWVDYLDVNIRAKESIQSIGNEQRSSCLRFLAILSPHYIGDDKCRSELSAAQEQHKDIIPILFNAPDSVSNAYENAIEFRSWRDASQYAQSFKKSLDILKDFVGEKPDQIKQYLNSLIAELASYEGVVDYLSLSVHAEPAEEDEREDEEDESDTDDEALDDEDDVEHDVVEPTRGMMLPLSDIHEALELHPACIVLGGAGSGKSTTLRRIALEKVWDYWSDYDENPLPIWIDLADGDDVHPQKLLAKNVPLESDTLAELILEDRLILFVDGLNEMGEDAPRRAKQLSDWLYEADSPEQVVVACRAASYGALLNLDLPIVALDPLDVEQIRKFSALHLESENWDMFLSQLIAEDETVKNPLIIIPMYLRKLIDIYQRSPQVSLPSALAKLLQQWTDLAWKQIHQHSTPFDLSEIEVDLSRLAAGMLDEQTPSSIEQEWAIQKISGKNQPDSTEHEAIVQRLMAADKAKLVQVNNDKVRFAHRLLGSYFAALTLQRDGVQHTVSAPVFDSKEFRRLPGKWDAPVMILLGLVDDRDAIVLEVAKRDPYLAAECIAAGISVTDETKQVLHDVLFEKLDQNDWRLTYTTVRALIRLGKPDLVWTMIEDLAYGDPFKQRVAAWALGEIRHPASIPVLVEALENDDIRTIVQKSLIKIGSPAISEMVQLLDEEEYETHWELRSTIAQTLLAIGDPEAIDYLLDSLYDSEYEVRWSAANAISGFSEAAVTGLLEVVFEPESLEDEDGDTCHAAASALVWIGTDSAIKGLLNALKDVDPSRRAIVAESLAEAMHPLVAPALIERLSDFDYAEWDDQENIAEIAAMSLERIGTPQAIEAVEKWRREKR